MRRLSAIFISLLLVCFCSLGRSNSYDFPLSAKVRRSVLIAEVRVDTTELRMRDPVLGDYELVCGCTILRGFKMPTPTNSVTLTIRYTQTRLYRGKTFLVFAVEDEVGYRRNRDQKPQLGYCPLRRGLIEKDQPSKWLLEPSAQDQPSTYQELGCSELIARVKAILTASPSLAAAGTDYYQHFRLLVDTNLVPLKTFPILVDTNNTGIKITNAVLNLESLKHGEISPLRLGMTMQEVVDRWGKPRGGWTRCLHGLITFSYSGVSLAFEGDCLETIRIYSLPKLAGGLSPASPMDDFVRVLGPPTSRGRSDNHCSLVYLSPGANLVLYFSGEELSDISLERTASRAEPWKQRAQASTSPK